MTAELELHCPKGPDACPIYARLGELQREVNNLQQQVRTDALTGLFNKRHLQLTLETEMERSRRAQQPTSLILLDIDHFKCINDRFGHPAGDRVLQALAQILLNEVRRVDSVYRFGGEEFAVVLPNTSQATAAQVAERLRRAMEAHPTQLETGEQVGTTASFGVSCYQTSTEESWLQFLQRADKQLYQAKARGRNCVVVEPAVKPCYTQGVHAQERQALLGASSREHAETNSATGVDPAE